MNTTKITKIIDKLSLAERANIAFSATLKGQEKLAAEIKNTIPFETVHQRHSKFVDRIQSLYFVPLVYAAECWKQNGIFFSSLNSLRGFDFHEDNAEILRLRNSRSESYRRLMALELIPETLERKFGIGSQTTTFLVDVSQSFLELDHPINWLRSINLYHDEYMLLFESYIE